MKTHEHSSGVPKHSFVTKKVKICPVCKSSDITLDMAGQSGKYLCKKCGYIGVLIIERNVGKENPKTKGNKE